MDSILRDHAVHNVYIQRLAQESSSQPYSILKDYTTQEAKNRFLSENSLFDLSVSV